MHEDYLLLLDDKIENFSSFNGFVEDNLKYVVLFRGFVKRKVETEILVTSFSTSSTTYYTALFPTVIKISDCHKMIS